MKKKKTSDWVDVKRKKKINSLTKKKRTQPLCEIHSGHICFEKFANKAFQQDTQTLSYLRHFLSGKSMNPSMIRFFALLHICCEWFCIFSTERNFFFIFNHKRHVRKCFGFFCVSNKKESAQFIDTKQNVAGQLI